MNVITKIGLKGVGPFIDPTVFKVQPGISYIYGKNLLAGGNPNFSGKSTFASAIAEIFYDEPVVGTRQDKAKSGSRFVEFRKGKKDVRVASSFKGKTGVLKVTVDGEDKSGRTKANTREAVDKVWPITQTDFNTYVYLDSAVPHPLARGSTAERKAFFNTFFSLDRLDAEKRILNAELLKLKKSRAAYNELKGSYEDLKGDLLEASVVVELERLEATHTKRVERLQKAAEEYQEIAQLVEFKRLAKTYLANLTCSAEEIPERLKAVKRLIRKAEQHQEEMDDFRAYLKDLAKYKEAVKGLDMETPLKELKAKSEQYQRAKSKVEDLEGQEKPKKVEKPVKPELDRKQLTGLQVQLEHALDHAKKFKTGVCPTCNQSVKAEPVEKTKARLAKVEAELEELDEYDQLLRKYNTYVEARKEWEAEQEELTKYKAEQKKLRPAHELYEKRRGLEAPEKVEKPEAVEGVEEAKEELKTLEFLAPHVDTIKKLKKVDLKKSVEFDPKELNKAQEEVSAVRTKLEVHRSVHNRAKTLRSRLKELKADLENEEALKLLLEGYSDKAVKSMIIDAISTHLMNTVNQFSSLVFSGYKFEFVWGPQVQLLVHRPKIGTTDVRKLSGAESKLFTLILVLALMRFVPKRKRLNMLILDEPTASFSAETTNLFHMLLPQINQLIPSILVVTPRSDERYAGAHEYTVVRDKGGSYIKKGHPDDV